MGGEPRPSRESSNCSLSGIVNGPGDTPLSVPFLSPISCIVVCRTFDGRQKYLCYDIPIPPSFNARKNFLPLNSFRGRTYVSPFFLPPSPPGLSW